MLGLLLGFALWAGRMDGADARVTVEERAVVLRRLDESRMSFLASLRGLTEAQWTWKPAPGKWSIAETAEHVVLFEEAYFGSVRQALAMPANPNWQKDTFGKTTLLETFVTRRFVKARAPEKLMPTGTLTVDQVRKRFENEHADMTKFVSETDLALKEHTVTNVSFGTLNCYQLLLYAPLHTLRHTQQIAEITSTGGYPQ